MRFKISTTINQTMTIKKCLNKSNTNKKFTIKINTTNSIQPADFHMQFRTFTKNSFKLQHHRNTFVFLFLFFFILYQSILEVILVIWVSEDIQCQDTLNLK